ncbi:MAG: hypothetical protein KME55_40640, partial [Nostoc indistinguendum CM1-VF10]|nr:hypothetical protein [Nostoc indistinguendum CM1-VF10]
MHRFGYKSLNIPGVLQPTQINVILSVLGYLNLIEQLQAEVKELRAENQQLKDENNRLKGEKGQPEIKANSK